jgi:VanZ family protein
MNELQQSKPLSRRAYLVRYWLPPFLCAALIFFLSSLPGKKYPYTFFSADKLIHVVEYAVLGYLVARAFGCDLHERQILFVRSLVVCVLYGISDELHQWFVPDRVVSVMDLLADIIGSVSGIGIYIKQRKVL